VEFYFFERERERESQSSQVNLCKKYPKASIFFGHCGRKKTKKTEREEEGFWLLHRRHRRSETFEAKKFAKFVLFWKGTPLKSFQNKKKPRFRRNTLSLPFPQN